MRSRDLFKNNPRLAKTALTLLTLLLLESAAVAMDVQTIDPETTSGLQAFYEALDYQWADLESGIPPFILKSIPEDINHSVPTHSKKKTFFMGLLPMVLIANKEIIDERKELLGILERHKTRSLKNGDRERLDQLKKRYGLSGKPLIDHRARKTLLRRVDSIPPSLVLAQAANESAWGTSRFAQMGNNIFGEWTYKPGTGIVPQDRPDGATYEVRKFSSIYQSIRSYMNNLNRNSAYRSLRDIREELRTSGKPVTGRALARGLKHYSERGEEYIEEIQAMIRQNQLEKINSVSLRWGTSKADALTSISTSGAGLFSSRNRIIGHRSDGEYP